MNERNDVERVELRWVDGFHFEGMAGAHSISIDGDGIAGATPVSLLLESVGACTAIDVVDILKKGRQDVRGLHAEVLAERNPDPPRYVSRLELRFRLEGDIDPKKARRAVDLSLEKYCSVFNSLRDDLEVEIEIDVGPAKR